MAGSREKSGAFAGPFLSRKDFFRPAKADRKVFLCCKALRRRASPLALYMAPGADFGVFGGKSFLPIVTGAAELTLVEIGHLHLRRGGQFFHLEELRFDVTFRTLELFFGHMELMAERNRT